MKTSLPPALALLLVGLLGLEAPDASAHFFVATPQVTIHRVGKRFFGRIKSHHAGCKRQRKVVLVRARRGISDRVVEVTRTGLRGRWSIRRPRPKGRYYAVIPRKNRRFYLHGHTCRRDRSRVTRGR